MTRAEEEQVVLGILRKGGCDCEPELTVEIHRSGWSFTHRHDPSCAYAVALGLQRGDSVGGTMGFS